MAKFETALPYVLRNEGGWSDDPNDPGGVTMRGITLGVASAYGIDTKEKLKSISTEMIGRIYRDGYWRLDGVVDQNVATKLFDMSVNMGLVTAVKLAQKELKMVDIDGKCGPATIRAINSFDPEKFLTSLCLASMGHYIAISTKNPNLKKFLNGWTKRAYQKPSA